MVYAVLESGSGKQRLMDMHTFTHQFWEDNMRGRYKFLGLVEIERLTDPMVPLASVFVEERNG